jgi:hypothetical protein
MMSSGPGIGVHCHYQRGYMIRGSRYTIDVATARSYESPH